MKISLNKMLSCHISCYKPFLPIRYRTPVILLGQNSESKMMIIQEDQITPGDKHYLAHNDMKATTKMYNNIHNIGNNILKLKPKQTKKYQVSGYHEYKKLVKFIEKHYFDIKFDILVDETLKKNKVKHIFGGLNSGCCKECDTLPSYESEKVPIIYFVATKS